MQSLQFIRVHKS